MGASRCSWMLNFSLHAILAAASSAAFMQPGFHTLRVSRSGRLSLRSGALRLRGGLASAGVLATEEPVGGGKGSTQRQYSSAGRLVSGEQGGSQVVGALGERVKLAVKATFLPAGFPASVPEEYARYQVLNIIQDLSSNFRGILSTQAILQGMGVGNAGVTALAATTQMVTRDGCSMIGGLLFTAVYSRTFSRDVKRWRLFADLINDAALAIDMVATMIPALFLPLICLSATFKALCGISAGACNAAITQHMAMRGNIADVGAKNGAQHTLLSLLAVPTGIVFAQAANVSPTRLAAAFLFLTATHVIANILALRCIAFRTLTPSSLARLLPALLAPRDPASASKNKPQIATNEATNKQGTFKASEEPLEPFQTLEPLASAAAPSRGALSPAELAPSDPLFFLFGRKMDDPPVFGASLEALAAHAPLESIIAAAKGEMFLLGILEDAPKDGRGKPRLGVAVHRDHTPRDLLRAFMATHILQRLLANRRDSASAPELFKQAIAEMGERFCEGEAALAAAGWEVGSLDLVTLSSSSQSWLAQW